LWHCAFWWETPPSLCNLSWQQNANLSSQFCFCCLQMHFCLTKLHTLQCCQIQMQDAEHFDLRGQRHQPFHYCPKISKGNGFFILKSRKFDGFSLNCLFRPKKVTVFHTIIEVNSIVGQVWGFYGPIWQQILGIFEILLRNTGLTNILFNKLVMGPGQKFLLLGLCQVSHLWFGYGFGKFCQIFQFLPFGSKKISSGREKSTRVGPLIYCGSKVCSGSSWSLNYQSSTNFLAFHGV